MFTAINFFNECPDGD